VDLSPHFKISLVPPSEQAPYRHGYLLHETDASVNFSSRVVRELCGSLREAPCRSGLLSARPLTGSFWKSHPPQPPKHPHPHQPPPPTKPPTTPMERLSPAAFLPSLWAALEIARRYALFFTSPGSPAKRPQRELFFLPLSSFSPLVFFSYLQTPRFLCRRIP